MMYREIQAVCHMVLFLQLIATHQPPQAIATEVIPLIPLMKDAGPTVRTRAGPVRGRRATDGDYAMFLGIPYAKVDPSNPFGSSIPQFFEDVFDAFDDSAKCPQIEEFNRTITGTLDCLHLNIYVPNSANVEKPLAVMVYIFGGQFEFGFASRYLYGPRFLVRHDVIFVSFNYRVGPYGFMCLDTPEVPGNQGFKDQVQALRWIKQNIHAFGGDESRITLFGNSAGGTAADIHGYFLKERLYDRTILQSGVALSLGLFQKPDPELPLKLAMQLNYTTNDINDALSFLSGVPAHEVIAATNRSGVHFGLCVENKFDNIDTYITEHPININRVNHVDVLLGFNNDESYVICAKTSKHECETGDLVSLSLNKSFKFTNDNLFAEIKDIVTHFYYGDEAICVENMKQRKDAYSDFDVYHPTLRAAQKYLDSGLENVYLYMFSYSGERSFHKHLHNVTHRKGGASHADDLGYLFDISYMKQRLQAQDMLIVDVITELWTNFAKYGNPTPWHTELIPLLWPRITREKMPYMEINTDMRVGSRPMRERMAFLDLLYKAFGKYQRL